MNNLKQLKQELEETKNKCAELEKKIEELEKQEIEVRWRAKEGGTYFYVCSNGNIDWNWDIAGKTSTNHYNLGNYFQTKEEAEKAVEKIKIYTQLKDLALRLNKGREIDWTNANQEKYYIGCNFKNELAYGYIYKTRPIGGVYCLNSLFLDIAKQEIGEENLRKLFE